MAQMFDRSWIRHARDAAQNFWRDAVLGETPAHDDIEATLNSREGSSPSGLHHILKYDQYADKTGLFYNDNAVAFCFSVVQQTGADEDMVSQLTTLFTPIPPGTGVQWCLFGSTRVDAVLEHYEDLRHEAVEAGRWIQCSSRLPADGRRTSVRCKDNRCGTPLRFSSSKRGSCSRSRAPGRIRIPRSLAKWTT
jgi:hypothetical protein